MKTIFASLFAAVLCLSLLAGCSSKKTIVGKWQNDKGAQFEFTTDGKLLVTMGGISMNGTYTLPDDGHFKMEMDLGGGQKQSETFGYAVNGDALTTDDKGKKETMKRVK